jgi:two-component system chemotaxis response regulator CheB
LRTKFDFRVINNCTPDGVQHRRSAGLLTGMGRDGAEELRLLKEKGAVTFAQDKDSSVVHGMPGEAIKLDAATFILAPDKIAAVLTDLANNKKESQR